MPTTRELVGAIKRADALSALEEDEAEPYKHKYEAADILKELLGDRAQAVTESAAPDEPCDASEPVGNPTPEEADGAPASSNATNPNAVPQPTAPPETAAPSEEDVAVAAARIRCGLILLDTDLLPDGESNVVAGLRLLEMSPEAYLAWLLESYNALGALYSQRGDFPTALHWLQRAEDLYRSVTATGTRHAHLTLPIAGQQAAPETATAAAAEAAAAAPEAPEAGVRGAGVGDGDVGQKETDGQGQEAGGSGRSLAETGTAPADGVDSGRDAAPAAAATAGAPPVSIAAGGGQTAVAAAAAEAATGEAATSSSGGGGEQEEPSSAPAGDEQGPEHVAVVQPSPSSAPEGPQEEGAPALSLAQQLPGNDDDAVQSQYTSTLYFLAQVYGHMKASDRSALYCAATLYRQLASGKYDLDTWVNNCLQLGGYYAKVHAYGLAMYCHAAAQAVVDRDTAAGAELADDIAANIKLAAARVYNMRLAASHTQYIEGKDLEVHYPDVSYFPDYLRFSGLAVPSPDSFPWGLSALASKFEAARELLNAGMPYFKEALSYYQLDGWVTDHVGIIMDMSNMYRCLAGFEPDPNRAAAMHRCRAQLLEPLSGALNPDHYPGLSRSIDLELAHVYREISDWREVQGGQAAKAAAAASTATKYYQRFLRSFAAVDTGQLPDRVDLDNEPYFLMASFGLGRMMHRMRAGTGSAAGDATLHDLLLAAHQHLQWTTAYVKRHGLEAWTQEAQAAEELSELLVERMRLQVMAAARKGTPS